MTSSPNRERLKILLKYFLLSVFVLLIFTGVWLFRLNSEIQTRIKQGWFKPPVEIYSRGHHLIVGQKLSKEGLVQILNLHQYRERFEEQTLRPGDFSVINGAQCGELIDESFGDPATQCVVFFIPTHEQDSRSSKSNLLAVMLSLDEKIEKIYKSQNGQWNEIARTEFSPQLFAQFYNDEPLMRTLIRVGDAPLQCLQAVTAIEDSRFLEHKGVSVVGLGRALLRNLKAGRYAQGGSTITQQLVKNYFLSSEKTLKRKISEVFMSILLEANSDKDQILESYLNVIYMGQRGPFQVIGLAAASDYYFAKSLSDLSLPECALLAAVINSPGRYSPFANPENAMARRNLVLDRMVETNMITELDATKAKTHPLPSTPKLRLTEPAPYFIQAVYRELKKLNIKTENGLKIFTTLDVMAQDLAQQHVLKHVRNLEKNNKKIAEIASAGKNLEASLISVELETGEVLALVGGRQYIKTQYNRVLDAHRQVGSVMKPFVYLTALESLNTDGEPFTPLTLIDDVPFSFRYEGQSWSPKNYTKEFYGRVPLFYALKNSLNSATAKLGIQVGLDNIVGLARRAGVTSPISPLPSLTLGAFELYSWEVATAMTTVARMGSKIDLSYIRKVQTLDDVVLYEQQPKAEQVFSSEAAAVLIGMMKQTLLTGTGRLAKLLGFDMPAAGKTGTTSDLKDTWFVGFTPYLLTVTWTGYDDNTPSTLTGANGALPLWIYFMKDYAHQFPNNDFNWPKGIRKKTISPIEFRSLITSPKDYELESTTELIFQ